MEQPMQPHKSLEERILEKKVDFINTPGLKFKNILTIYDMDLISRLGLYTRGNFVVSRKRTSFDGLTNVAYLDPVDFLRSEKTEIRKSREDPRYIPDKKIFTGYEGNVFYTDQFLSQLLFQIHEFKGTIIGREDVFNRKIRGSQMMVYLRDTLDYLITESLPIELKNILINIRELVSRLYNGVKDFSGFEDSLTMLEAFSKNDFNEIVNRLIRKRLIFECLCKKDKQIITYGGAVPGTGFIFGSDVEVWTDYQEDYYLQAKLKDLKIQPRKIRGIFINLNMPDTKIRKFNDLKKVNLIPPRLGHLQSLLEQAFFIDYSLETGDNPRVLFDRYYDLCFRRGVNIINQEKPDKKFSEQEKDFYIKLERAF